MVGECVTHAPIQYGPIQALVKASGFRKPPSQRMRKAHGIPDDEHK
jgi:hypothetical protein